MFYGWRKAAMDLAGILYGTILISCFQTNKSKLLLKIFEYDRVREVLGGNAFQRW